MASRILSNAILVNLEIQSGDGVPSHLNKVGYLYVDRGNGDYYVGKGGVTWDLLSSGGGTGDTFVNSFVYNDANKFTITRNDAVSLDAKFDSVTGLTINGDLIVTGITSAATLNITTTPTNNNSLTEILGRNSSTGEIEYRDVSTIGGGSTGDTFVTAFTYNNLNKLTLSRNEGQSDLDVDINIMSGLTINGDLLVTGITSASTLNITTTPTNNNSLTEILGRNSSSGEIEYRDVSTIGGGGGSINVTVVTGATYSATSSDNVIGVDTSLIPVTIYLPDSVSTGIVRYEVKDIGVNSYQNPITIQANISDTIITTDLVPSFDLSADGGAVILVSTGGGQWWQM